MCPVAVNMLLVYRQQNCCQFVARLLLDTKSYKSTVTYECMLPSTYVVNGVNAALLATDRRCGASAPPAHDSRLHTMCYAALISADQNVTYSIQ